MSVTDGTITVTDEAEKTVRVVGTVTATPSGTQGTNITQVGGNAVTTTVPVSGTVTANQGTPAATANAWPTKVGNGSANVDVAPSAPSAQGNALLVTTGILTAPATLTNQSATANGTTVDFGAAKQCITLVVTAGAGVSAGVVTLQVSQDNTNFYAHTTTITTSAPGVSQTSITGVAFRYARGVISTTITGGTVSATIQGT